MKEWILITFLIFYFWGFRAFVSDICKQADYPDYEVEVIHSFDGYCRKGEKIIGVWEVDKDL